MRALNILVVDDDHDNADSMAELFELENHNVCTVYNGLDAIEAYQKSNFDISFLDVMMPGMNGVDSFLAIRKLRPQANVFMMSGYSVEELLKQAVDHGALGLLTKPVSPQVVLNMVQSVGPNGLVVAQGQGPAFTEALSWGLQSTGGICDVVHTSSQLVRADVSNFMILDVKETLIDSICQYTRLRKTQIMPPTVILSQPLVGGADTDGLGDVDTTGILNKPFDPEKLIQKLNKIAA